MRSLAFVGVRLVTLYLLVMALIQFSVIVPSLLSLEVAIWKLVVGAGLVLVAGPMLAMVLFMLAGPISKMLVADEPAELTALDVGGLERALFAAVGLFFVLGGLSDLSWTVYNHWRFSAVQHSDTQLAQVHWGYVSHAVKLILGTAVLLGARGLHGLLQRLRSFGLAEK